MFNPEKPLYLCPVILNTEISPVMDKKIKDLSTEEKIKAAARKIFTKKGYSATRTRDIADEAGINLALLNYYFRSKEKLFNLVFLENFGEFLEGVRALLNDRTTSLEQKIDALPDLYISKIMDNPDLPLFILNEIRTDPRTLKSRGLTRDLLWNSYFMEQLIQEMAKRKKTGLAAIHQIMNIFSMTIFPFIAAPLIREVTGLGEKEFFAIMEERRRLIPVWIKKLLLDQ